MIAGLIFGMRAWRRVSGWRIAAAIAIAVGADLAAGAIVAALLGGRRGWGP